MLLDAGYVYVNPPEKIREALENRSYPMLDDSVTTGDLLRQLFLLGWKRDTRRGRMQPGMLAAFDGPGHGCGRIELARGVDVHARLPTWWLHRAIPRLGLTPVPIALGEQLVYEARQQEAALFRRKMLEPRLEDFVPVCAAQAEQRAAWEASEAFKRGFARDFAPVSPTATTEEAASASGPSPEELEAARAQVGEAGEALEEFKRAFGEHYVPVSPTTTATSSGSPTPEPVPACEI